MSALQRSLPALLLALGALAACGAGGDPSAEVATAPTDPTDPTELAAHDGEPCPEELPQASEETHGSGTDAPATERPSLPTADEAWVCSYGSETTHRRGDGDAVVRWQRRAEPVVLPTRRLDRVQTALAGLEPPPAGEGRACTADFGPRWLLVLSDDGDLTGVVVDDYGCHDVRLTPDPHTVVPGQAEGDGVVAGVLDGGVAVLDALGVGRPLR
ncbi:hypothetical protein [Nocardioides sp. SYSU DS0663]|uniref:hypothetical protein n=1 Tax=Nocardioides sp. SYSU DS0663 TaxID=3416445 RepID=UPI003F4BE45B